MLQRAIWTVNSQYFEENKCIIVFDRESRNSSVSFNCDCRKKYIINLVLHISDLLVPSFAKES